MSLFLSRILLNAHSRQVMSELAQPYEMHRTLMRAFPQVPAEEKAKAREKYGILFRADVDERNNSVKVYVQSAIEPNWSFLDSLNGYLSSGNEGANPAYKDVSGTLQKIQSGQVFSFRLRANPTKRLTSHSKEKDGNPVSAKWAGKRIELVREEDQINWLIRKAKEREKDEPGGFEIAMKKSMGQDGHDCLIPCLNVCSEGKLKGLKRDGQQGHEMKHFAVRFDGLLRVTDAEAFRKTIICGIGAGKAYGFGLLSVAPVGKADHAD
jgi:CRISPR system Cascade subunit CasE